MQSVLFYTLLKFLMDCVSYVIQEMTIRLITATHFYIYFIISNCYDFLIPKTHYSNCV